MSTDLDLAEKTLAEIAEGGASEADVATATLDVQRLRIARDALEQRNATDWAYAAPKGNYGEGTNKCNLFVHDTLKLSNVAPPLANGGSLYNTFGIGEPKYPVLAGQWADPNYGIPGWNVVTSDPKPGDVIATSAPGPAWTGHVGIFVGRVGDTRWTSSAATNQIVVRDWPFSIEKQPYTTRRLFGSSR